jgi:hypothetical protein
MTSDAVSITVSGIDVSDWAIFPECEFSCGIKTEPGQFTLSLLDGGFEFIGGENVRLYIGEKLYFGGHVMSVTRTNLFPAGNELGDANKLVLSGTDYSHILDRFIAYDHLDGRKELKSFKSGVSEGAVLRYCFAHYFDVPDGMEVGSYITSGVAIDTDGQPWKAVRPGDSMKSLLSLLSRTTKSVWFIDPYFRLHVQEQYERVGSYSLADDVGSDAEGNVIGIRDVTLWEDMTQMANDALVWGVENDPVVFHRTTSDGSVGKYGTWQQGEWSQQMYKNESVTQRARMIVERLGLEPFKFFRATVFRHGIYPGDLVPVSLTQFGISQEYTCKRMTVRFIAPSTPSIILDLGLKPEDPWTPFDMVPFRPLKDLGGMYTGSPFDFSSSDQPHMPVIQTWSRNEGGMVEMGERYELYVLEGIESYHWSPAYHSWAEVIHGMDPSTWVPLGPGEVGGIWGPIMDSTLSYFKYFGPVESKFHTGGVYRRFEANGFMFYGLGHRLFSYKSNRSQVALFTGTPTHIYAGWQDWRQFIKVTPEELANLGVPGVSARARLEVTFQEAANFDAWPTTSSSAEDGTLHYHYFDGMVGSLSDQVGLGGMNDVNTVWTQRSYPMTFQVRRLETEPGELYLEPPSFPSLYPFGDTSLRDQAVNGSAYWLYGSEYVGEYEVDVAELRAAWDNRKTVHFEVPYPNPEKDTYYTIFAVTPRIASYGGETGPCTWGYYHPTNDWPARPDPWSTYIPSGYEFGIATFLFSMNSSLNYPTKTLVNMGSVKLQGLPQGGIFPDENVLSEEWDGILDEGWGSEPLIDEFNEDTFQYTGWFITTYPFVNETLQVYVNDILISSDVYEVEPITTYYGAYPRRFKIPLELITGPAWVRYLHRPLHVQSHAPGRFAT